jgi:hypothetical protein
MGRLRTALFHRPGLSSIFDPHHSAFGASSLLMNFFVTIALDYVNLLVV